MAEAVSDALMGRGTMRRLTGKGGFGESPQAPGTAAPPGWVDPYDDMIMRMVPALLDQGATDEDIDRFVGQLDESALERMIRARKTFGQIPGQ